MPGIVAASIFVGSTHVFLVRMSGQAGAILQIQVPADEIAPFEKNDNVDILFDENALHFFPAERRAA
jgi:mannopine transport system ATP-binding protein